MEWESLYKHKYGLLAIIVPVGIRAIPEFLAGPNPIGFDVISYYVPVTLDWAAGTAGWASMLSAAPLLYVISVPTFLLFRVDPIWIFKVLGPMLYGTMIWATFRFLRLSLNWSETHSLGGALSTSLYFVTLRIGWDLYRSMLGMTFIILSLPLLSSLGGRKAQITLSALIVLAVVSDQFTGAIALFLVAIRTASVLLRAGRRDFLRLVAIQMPGLFAFLSILLSAITLGKTGIAASQYPMGNLSSIGSNVEFLLYAYAALTPLIVLGLRRIQIPELRNWCVFCLLASVASLLPMFDASAISYRWSLLLDIPLCIYAAAGLVRISKATYSMGPRKSRFKGALIPAFCMIITVSAALYLVLPSETPVIYFEAFPYSIPTSMAQSSVPLSAVASLRQLLGWVASNRNNNSVLITHQAVYGWAREYLPSSQIINYGYSTPETGLEWARAEGYSSVYLIWWANGHGWYGLATVGEQFDPIQRNGDLAVYAHFSPSSLEGSQQTTMLRFSVQSQAEHMPIHASNYFFNLVCITTPVSLMSTEAKTTRCKMIKDFVSLKLFSLLS